MALRTKKNPTSVSAQEALAELFIKLKDLSCDPIKELATFAMDPVTPLHDRILILKELAQYTAPKRRAVDIVADGSDDGLVVKIVKYTKDTKGQAEKMMNPNVVSAIKKGEVPYGEEEQTEKAAEAGG